MASFEERLIRQFGDWVMLGGGRLPPWPEPVSPEPPFVPFTGYRMRGDLPAVDDGRRPTALSGMVESLRFREDRAGSHEDGNPEEDEEVPGYLVDEFGECVEFVLTLPGDVSWPPQDFEPFLYAACAGGPVCFEYRANSESISLQVIAPESSRSELATTFATDLPGVLVEPRPMQLESWILEPEPDQLWMGELALQREFFAPVLTPREIARDPHVSLLGAMGFLEGPERVVVQIRFAPCVNSWADSVWQLIADDRGKPPFDGATDFLAEAKAKLRKPLFAVTIRLAVVDASDERLEPIARRLVAGFAAYDGPNSFVFADGFDQEPGEMLFDLIHRKSHRSGMLLNSDELLGLVHLPAAPAGEPKLRRIRHHTHPAPAGNLGSKDLLLGINRHLGNEHEVGLTVAERCRHMHVIGASGTGKSTFLLQSILQDLESGHGFALLDPHGDLVEAVLDRLPEERVDDLVLFDPADADHPVGFNILRAHSEIEKNLLASDFVAIFERLSTSWGDQMTTVLGNAAMAFLESDTGGTLMELKRFLIEPGFRERFLRTVRDPEIRYFWHKEFPLLRGTTQASLLTRLNGFLRHRLIRNMVRQSGERFDVARMMDEGKVILAPLAQGLIGQENSWLLGSLLVSRFYQAALSRQSMSEGDRRPFFLYLDEAHHFVTPSIASILSGSRKYGLGLILAHQSMDQFPSRESGILDSVLTNSYSRICFRLGERDAPRIESAFDHFRSEDFRRLGTGEAICRVGESDADFTLSTGLPRAPDAGAAKRRAKAIEGSRSRYATPREEVEPSDADTLPTVPDRVERPPEPKAGKQAKRAREPLATEPPPELAEPEQQPPEPVIAIPEAASESPPDPPVSTPRSPGRGGSRHKFLQNLIKQHANGLGLRATIEAPLPDNAGSVDVLVEGTGLSIAFEVALKSPLEQEVKNVRKSIEAGIDRIVVVSEYHGHLEAIRSALGDQDAAGTTRRVEFLHSEKLPEVFEKLGAQLAAKETVSRGFRVKVNYQSLPRDRRDARQDEIHRAVADDPKKSAPATGV